METRHNQTAQSPLQNATWEYYEAAKRAKALAININALIVNYILGFLGNLYVINSLLVLSLLLTYGNTRDAALLHAIGGSQEIGDHITSVTYQKISIWIKSILAPYGLGLAQVVFHRMSLQTDFLNGRYEKNRVQSDEGERQPSDTFTPGRRLYLSEESFPRYSLGMHPTTRALHLTRKLFACADSIYHEEENMAFLARQPVTPSEASKATVDGHQKDLPSAVC